ncbi:MAG: PIN domain nuclease [Bryobacterales bacterium]|nr:PIN domain nuclease [Bryobacterales bacterium]
MTLIDTSAWVEFLRDTGSLTCERVTDLLAAEIAVCDAILMEVLAGARNERHLLDLRRLLARATVLPTRPIHYEHAATLYRQCRQRGATVRKLIDCLIAAVALDAEVAILHCDADFSTLAAHCGLRATE